MSNPNIQAMNIGLQLFTALVDNVLFAAAFHHHTVKGIEFDEALDHTLECLTYTKNRIPEFVQEKREASEAADGEE